MNSQTSAKLKILSAHYKTDIIYWVLIILFSFLFFGLGYTYAQNTTHNPIIIEKCSNP